MSNPKVSIIIPVYNLEAYIGATIESCTRQTYRDIEIIVVNDGSADNSEAVISGYLGDKRIKYIKQPNSGVSAARDKGVAEAKGEYIMFLDGDDLLQLDTVKKNIELIDKQNTLVDWLAFPIVREDENGNCLDTASSNLLDSYRYDNIKTVDAREAFSMYESRLLPPIVCSMIFRRGFFDRKFVNGRYEDTYMFLELLSKNPGILISPYGAYRYINREGSFINKSFTPQKWIDYTRVQIKHASIGALLFPEQAKKYTDKLTSTYYNLKYLKFKNRKSLEFAKPLEFFLTEVQTVKPDYKKEIVCFVKCILSLFIK